MTCTNPILLKKPDKALRINIKKVGLYVPCGKCISCRIARTREWATRILHEASMYEHNSFLTLTYDDENIPENGSLRKKDLQDFIKRLRYHLGSRRIKYFGCGEYGDITNRPHYHVILLNWHSDLDKDYNLRTKKIGKKYKYSPLVADVWPFGIHTIGAVEYDSIRYCTQYIQKKYSGYLAEEKYKGIEPPFQIQSLGMGLSYLQKNEDYFKDKLGCTVRGKEVGLPRYYKKKLGIPTQVLLEKAEEREKELLSHHGFNEFYDDGFIPALKRARRQANANREAEINKKQKKL